MASVVTSLADPVGLVTGIISLASFIGIECPAQHEKLEEILTAAKSNYSSIKKLEKEVKKMSSDLKKSLDTATINSIQNDLRGKTGLDADVLSKVIRLLLAIKEKAENVVMAIIVRYEAHGQTGTLAFSARSAACVQEIVERLEDFRRSLSQISYSKTCYINTRIRGKYQASVENLCNAALYLIAHQACGLSSKVELQNTAKSMLESAGRKTVILMHPMNRESPRSEYDGLQRTFLIGDTRTGKSTLGNALLKRNTFSVSEGTTGTLRIQRDELVETKSKKAIVTEFYDTPGLNDKDGLDHYHETAIQDQIKMLQRASTLMITVSVDGGITDRLREAVASYKKLFGKDTISMLLIVLTLNKSCSKKDLAARRDFNWPSIVGLDQEIRKNNVYCISLHDLRTRKKDSESFKVVQQLRHRCQTMPMRIIASVRERYEEVRRHLKRKAVNVKKELKVLMDENWMKYDSLAKEYEACDHVKMMDVNSDKYNGFVMKHTNTWVKLINAVTFGGINLTRKVIVRLRSNTEQEKAWAKMLKRSESCIPSADRMKYFGDMLFKDNLGVLVKEQDVQSYQNLSYKQFVVRVFDPASRAHEEIVAYLSELIDGKEEVLSKDVLNSLIRNNVPKSIRCDRKGSDACKMEGHCK